MPLQSKSWLPGNPRGRGLWKSRGTLSAGGIKATLLGVGDRSHLFCPNFLLQCPNVNISVNKQALKSHDLVLKDKTMSPFGARVLPLGEKKL